MDLFCEFFQLVEEEAMVRGMYWDNQMKALLLLLVCGELSSSPAAEGTTGSRADWCRQEHGPNAESDFGMCSRKEGCVQGCVHKDGVCVPDTHGKGQKNRVNTGYIDAGAVVELSDAEKAVLAALRVHSQTRSMPQEVSEALKNLQQTQRAALADLSRARFVYMRMNPAAGLGNRLVAMVSGLYMAAATGRGFLVDWESYDEPRTHRSKEVSTMAPMDHFFDLPFACDAAALLHTAQLQREFGWDFPHWRKLNDEVVTEMQTLLNDDLSTAFPQRVVVISAISYFGQLLLDNPRAAGRLAGLNVGRRPFMHAANYLLRPASAIRSAVDVFYLKHMAGRHVVAVHLRTIEYMSPLEQRTALRCAHFLAQGSASSILIASDTAAGMQTAQDELGEGFLRFQSTAPGRSGERALADGWANIILLSKAQALVATSRSSYALLAAGLAGASAESRPLYDVYSTSCIKVVCTMPVLQRDHPLAKALNYTLANAYNSSCLSRTLRVTV